MAADHTRATCAAATETPDRRPVDEIVRELAARLADAGIDSARWDAEQLVSFVAEVPRSRLPATSTLSQEQEQRLAALAARRADRVPLQHLVGTVGFRYIELAVGPGVFIPRPETEQVAGVAIELARAAGPAPVVVDLCAGSGAIALSVGHEVPGAHVHAVEVDEAALAWLHRNADALSAVGDRAVAVHHGDVAVALPGLEGSVDVVVSNPPYVADHELDDVEPEVRDHDPRIALVAGADGLSVIRAVATRAWQLLRPGGWLVVEHADRQRDSAPGALRAAGFVDVTDSPDLAGRPRIAKGRRP